jgi:MFS transporter, ACS family, pantothenate transporter
MQNLDQSNLTNAYVSGMKEQLKMYGNEYNNAISIWTVGYIIGPLVRSQTFPST